MPIHILTSEHEYKSHGRWLFGLILAHRARPTHKGHGGSKIIIQQLCPATKSSHQQSQHHYKYQHHHYNYQTEISSPHPNFHGQKAAAGGVASGASAFNVPRIKAPSHLLSTNSSSGRSQLEGPFQKVTQKNNNQTLLSSSSGISQETLNQSVGSSRANSLPRPLSPSPSTASDKHDGGDPHVSTMIKSIFIILYFIYYNISLRQTGFTFAFVMSFEHIFHN